MKIAYISRLFSGIAQGIREGCWEPRGVPTVCRLLEALDASSHDLNIIFTVKDINTEWSTMKASRVPISGLNSPITVLPQTPFQSRRRILTNGYLCELYQYLQIRKIIQSLKPDLVYFDRVNVYAAALTALGSKTPVVWRIMGVPPAMHNMLKDNGLVAKITRLAYRAPFAMVICSRDGSGGEQWMEDALSKNIPRSIMLNGADKPRARTLPENIKSLMQRGKTKVLFVSRLVEHKGCLDFIQAACRILSKHPDSFNFI